MDSVICRYRSELAAYCGGVLAQVGHGDAATDPSLDPGAYTWIDAA